MSGRPDQINLLAEEMTRAGRAWQDSGEELERILRGLGLSTGAARSIGRAGRWVADQKRDLERRRDELLKTDQQQVVQAAANAAQLALAQRGKTGNPLEKAWNDYAHHYLPGLWEGSKDLGLSALASNPLSAPVYYAFDADGWAERGPIGQVKGLIDGAQHPVQFAKAVANWEEWKNDPIRAFGHVVPGLVLTIATGGGGIKAVGRIRAKLKTSKPSPDAERGHAAEAKPSTPPEQPKPADKTPPKPASGDVKVGGKPSGDKKVAGGGGTTPSGDVKPRVPEYTAQQLKELSDAAGGLRGVYEQHGPELAGKVIGQETLSLSSGKRLHIMRRVEELGLPQQGAADVAMAAAQRAWGSAGQIRLPDGRIAVVPGHPTVPDTFVVGKDGEITLRRSRRIFEKGSAKARVEFLD
ncbi:MULTISPECIES: SPOR domain-containing protein [Actinomadura]|uniref:SPOR domain-containing protein n=1 Tax=Actinomadura yumaensis TaxID=111807 RepID=A0ABW2CPQ3_9ACTN|nr:hypothetical protein [Actinomadura sp. J1-007]MWK36739.1 hypothetical protein [Actinomadura sp. J1-007]